MIREGRDDATRRRYLRRAAVGAVVGVAGCLDIGGLVNDEGESDTGDGGGSGDGTETVAPDTETATETPESGWTGTDAGPGAGTSTPALSSIQGTYRAYRAGPERRSFAPGAGAPADEARKALTLPLTASVYQPVVAGSTLYLARQSHEPGEPTVEAFDLASQTWLGGRDLNVPANGPPTVTDDLLFVATPDGTYALTPDGTIEWSTSEGASSGFVPTATDDRVFVVGDGDLTTLTHDGSVEWTIPLGDDPLAAPAADESTVYLPLPRGDNATLVAFDAADGTSRWRRSVTIDRGSPPVVAGETVYTASELVQGGVTAVSTADGNSRWEGTARPSRPPAVTADYVVSAGRGLVRAYATDGSTAWEADVVDDILAGPVATDDTVYVGIGTQDLSVLLAFDIASGETRWSLPFDRPIDAPLAILDGGLVVVTREGSGAGRVHLVTEA
jgi:outer membrane protein assembly factor BamB